MEIFDNDEEGYTRWVLAHPEGFVVNVDRAQKVPHYPMVHQATHKLISSQEIGNFTTGKFLKICSADLQELDNYSQSKYGRSLNYCSVCMGFAEQIFFQAPANKKWGKQIIIYTEKYSN